MKTTLAIECNIDQNVIGKIKIKNGKHFLLTSVSKTRNLLNRIKIVKQSCRVKENQKFIIVKDPTIFKNEDIIQVEKSGKIIFLYEYKSNSNLIFVTNLCNSSCIMCPQIERNDTSFFQRNIKLISLMNTSTNFLAFTGGEPTLLDKEFLSLLALCKKKLRKTKIEILTNGILLNDIDYVKNIILLNHPGLSFHVPLYSDIASIHDAIIGREGFFKTIKGLHNLAKFNQNIELRIVIHKQNYKRLPKLAEFIYRNLPFVNHIALMGMEYEGNANKNINSLWIDPYDYREILKETVEIFNQRALNVSIFNHQLCIIDKQIWKFSKKSISAWKNKYVDACDKCIQKSNCGGFFSTSRGYFSNYIKPITEMEK